MKISRVILLCVYFLSICYAESFSDKVLCIVAYMSRANTKTSSDTDTDQYNVDNTSKAPDTNRINKNNNFQVPYKAANIDVDKFFVLNNSNKRDSKSNIKKDCPNVISKNYKRDGCTSIVVGRSGGVSLVKEKKKYSNDVKGSIDNNSFNEGHVLYHKAKLKTKKSNKNCLTYSLPGAQTVLKQEKHIENTLFKKIECDEEDSAGNYNYNAVKGYRTKINSQNKHTRFGQDILDNFSLNKLGKYNYLLVRYGIGNNVKKELIHHPRYLDLLDRPSDLYCEINKIHNFFNTDNIRFKEELNKRVHAITCNLISLGNMYPILDRNHMRVLYNIVSVAKHANISLALSYLEQIDSIVQSLPILTYSKNRVTSHFGPRKLPRKAMRMHAGVDLVNDNKDKAIYASASGVVEFVGMSGNYGNLIIINHGKCKTKYAHLRSFFVRKGDTVTQGDIVGIEGATGKATGKHLHMEVIIRNKSVDPIDFIQYSLGRDYKEERMIVASRYVYLDKKSLPNTVSINPELLRRNTQNSIPSASSKANKMRKTKNIRVAQKSRLLRFVKEA